jgi:hypothetical protein
VWALLVRPFLGLSVDFDLVTAASLGDTPRLGKRGGVEEVEVVMAVDSVFSSSTYDMRRPVRGRRVEVLLLVDE